MFHPLSTSIEPPPSLNNPFCYEPHALTLLAARQLCDYLSTQTAFADDIALGKMFGVLVCRDNSGQTGFLAAYSGQLLGRADWPWFVPGVFDYLQPDGHFKREEACISSINRQVEELLSSDEYLSLSERLNTVREEGDTAIAAYRQYMQECKARRDAERAALGASPSVGQQGTVGHADEARLTAESQYQKAELRRRKRLWQSKASEVEQLLMPIRQRIESLKEERRRRSDALQQWLFDNFTLLNVHGERRSLASIFADTPQHTPPSGAGECCAPKLLHYAFVHHLQPLCIGELWQGRSPQMEVRHHGQFYPACRGKCKPILEWMLDIDSDAPSAVGADDGKDSPSTVCTQRAPLTPQIVYEDADVIVVVKPSGLLSVPGKQGLPSVESILAERYGQVFMPHRLDMDTSGLMVIARTTEAYHHLQRQFLQHTVKKEYEALLDGVLLADRGLQMPSIVCPNGEGSISLPLRPDLTDRPRQLVDRMHGRKAVTTYKVLGVENGRTRVLLIPHTGRTHQLRVHCAHSEGLGTPIVGDCLYGKTEKRLCLHARMLSFVHPTLNKPLTFHSNTPF